MIKIITFMPHDNPERGGGTLAYCKALEQLFKNSSSIHLEQASLLPHNSILGFKYNLKEIETYLKKTKPDIIHINGYTSLLLSQLTPLANKLGIKLVYTPHWHPFNTMKRPLLKKLYFSLFIKPYLKKINAIVCINKEDFSFYKQFSNKVFLIPHWINPEKSKPKIEQTERIDNQILFVGSLTHPNKGFQYLFNLPENKYRILCVGRGENISIRSDMTRLKNISSDELDKLYHQSALVVIPSKYEAFSYVALEALCAGTPIVVSERVRIADFLPNFEGMKIFNLSSPQQFVNSVEEMIGKSFDNSIINDQFSMNYALKAYTNLYSKVSKSQ